jgi:hypothetical protein
MEQPGGGRTAALSGSLLRWKREVGVVRTIGANHEKRSATDATPERATKQPPCGSERATNLAPLDVPSDSHLAIAQAAWKELLAERLADSASKPGAMNWCHEDSAETLPDSAQLPSSPFTSRPSLPTTDHPWNPGIRADDLHIFLAP